MLFSTEWWSITETKGFLNGWVNVLCCIFYVLYEDLFLVGESRLIDHLALSFACLWCCRL